MIRIYRAPWSTNCERIALALAHKGLEAESVMIEYSDRSAVHEVSGQGLVPVLVDDGDVVSDSVAIMHHLDRKYGEPLLFPPEDPARAHCEVFVEWFNEVYKAAPNRIEEVLEGEAPAESPIAALATTIAGHLDLLDRMLAGADHFLGEFSAADIVAYPHVKYAASRSAEDDELFHLILDDHQSVEDRPRLAAWIARMARRPMAFSAT